VLNGSIFFRDVAQCYELGRRFVVGEMASGLDNFAQLRIDAFHGVGRLDHLPGTPIFSAAQK